MSKGISPLFRADAALDTAEKSEHDDPILAIMEIGEAVKHLRRNQTSSTNSDTTTEMTQRIHTLIGSIGNQDPKKRNQELQSALTELYNTIGLTQKRPQKPEELSYVDKISNSLKTAHKTKGNDPIECAAALIQVLRQLKRHKGEKSQMSEAEITHTKDEVASITDKLIAVGRKNYDEDSCISIGNLLRAQKRKDEGHLHSRSDAETFRPFCYCSAAR